MSTCCKARQHKGCCLAISIQLTFSSASLARFRLCRYKPPTGLPAHNRSPLQSSSNHCRPFSTAARLYNMNGTTANKPGKRLIVACDGTWLDSDNGFTRDSYLPWITTGHLSVPSNVTRLVRALKPVSSDNIPQIAYYQAGIGSSNSWFDHYWGGATGAGISEHVREAYAFLAENHVPGDEIFLLGFSRGAFTARSIGGFIAAVGLLTRRGMDNFYPVFDDWENQVKPHYKSEWPDLPFPNKPRVTDPAYFKELVNLNLAQPEIPTVRAVGVWETVGALGIPQVLWPHPMDYAFTNSKVSPIVEHAFQALALDEQRAPYHPTIWEEPSGPNKLKILKQCWFSGVHTNVGGGYDDAGNANITLAWMMSQLRRLLDFDEDYIDYLHHLQVQRAVEKRETIRRWGLGELINSQAGIRALAGSKVRTPGQYYATNPHTGASTKMPLRHTNESVHPSVRVRLALKGKGIGDHGMYNPKALKGWKIANTSNVDVDEGDPQAEGFEWTLEKGRDGSKVVLKEEQIGSVERRLYFDFGTTPPSIS